MSQSLTRFAFGAALALVAIVVQLPLALLFGHDTYQLFLAAVAIAAIRGGTGNGAFTLIFSVFAKGLLFLLPSYPGHGDMGLFLDRIITFLFMGGAVGWLGGAFHDSAQRQSELLARARLLTGLLPICAACKRIRDDRGRWCQMQTYITAHSDAQFSHGFCPKCASEAFPEVNALQ